MAITIQQLHDHVDFMFGLVMLMETETKDNRHKIALDLSKHMAAHKHDITNAFRAVLLSAAHVAPPHVAVPSENRAESTPRTSQN